MALGADVAEVAARHGGQAHAEAVVARAAAAEAEHGLLVLVHGPRGGGGAGDRPGPGRGRVVQPAGAGHGQVAWFIHDVLWTISIWDTCRSIGQLLLAKHLEPVEIVFGHAWWLWWWLLLLMWWWWWREGWGFGSRRCRVEGRWGRAGRVLVLVHDGILG